MKNAIAWFEIPTTQLDRAQAFYEAVLGQPLRRENMGPERRRRVCLRRRRPMAQAAR